MIICLYTSSLETLRLSLPFSLDTAQKSNWHQLSRLVQTPFSWWKLSVWVFLLSVSLNPVSLNKDSSLGSYSEFLSACIRVMWSHKFWMSAVTDGCLWDCLPRFLWWSAERRRMYLTCFGYLLYDGINQNWKHISLLLTLWSRQITHMCSFLCRYLYLVRWNPPRVLSLLLTCKILLTKIVEGEHIVLENLFFYL